MISSFETLRALHAEPHRGIDDQLLDLRVGTRRAALVEIEALAGLLAEAALLGERVGDLGAHAALLARAPADVDAGEVAHRERPHREAELGERAVHVLRQRAFEQQLLGLDAARRQHAVADEAVAHADHHRHLVDLAPDRHRGREHVRRGILAAHDFQQLHHVRGREEVHAEHVGHAAASRCAISSTSR